MPKLFISILCLFAISLGLLQLRQARLNYRFEINRLHDKIESSQAQLWNQQLKIAAQTTPEALVRHQLQVNPPARQASSTSSSEGIAPSQPVNSSERRWLDSRVVP